MNRESLDKLCERGILGLVLAILVFTPLAFGGLPQDPVGSSWDRLATNPFAIVTGMTAAVVALWGVRLWISPRPQFLWPPMSWAVIAFACYAVIRYLTADIEYVARQEMLQHGAGETAQKNDYQQRHQHECKRAAGVESGMKENHGEAERSKPEMAPHPDGGPADAPERNLLTRPHQSGVKHHSVAQDAVNNAG